MNFDLSYQTLLLCPEKMIKRRSTLLPTVITAVVLLLVLSWVVYNRHITTKSVVSVNTVVTIINQQSNYLESLRKAHGINSKDEQKITEVKSSGHEVTPNSKTMKVSPTSKAKNKPIQKLHAVMYASHHGRDDRFCRAVESAARHDFPLVILGWQKPWRGLSQKLEAAHHYASTMPPDDIILFTDAFDVLFTRKANTILEPYLAQNASIIFAGECGCWPHIMEDKSACFSKYPESPTPYRYLNSGTWIGVAKVSKDMLLEVMKRAGTNFANANDQRLVADMFIARKFDIALDYHSTIFQSMHRTDPPDLPFCNPVGDLRFDSKAGRYRNTRTNSIPAIFHFNGGGKAHHLEMEGKMWYKKTKYYQGEDLTKLANYIIRVPDSPKYPDGTITFQELCGDYLRQQKERYI